MSERVPGMFAVSMRCGHEVYERCDRCKNTRTVVRHPDATLTQVCEGTGKSHDEVRPATG